jgi:streptogramin lyase
MIAGHVDALGVRWINHGQLLQIIRLATHDELVGELRAAIEATERMRVVRDMREWREARAAGAHGAMITVQGGNVVGRLNPANGQVRVVRMPERGSRPYGIVLDARGRPWFNLFGSNKLGTIDPATMQLREIVMPDAAAPGASAAAFPPPAPPPRLRR